VVMTVHHVDVVAADEAGDTDGQRGAETRPALEGEDRDAGTRQLGRPVPRVVEAAHRRIDRRSEPPADLNHQTLGAARRKAENELHDSTTLHVKNDELR